MIATHHLTEEDYQRIVFADPEHQWELYDGQLRERPGMSWEHGRVVMLLSRLLLIQLDLRQFEIRINEGRVRRSPSSIFIPDLIVIPASFGALLGGRPGSLAIITDPLPLVVEVLSRSTGDYDVDAKLPIYQERGDLEIWRIHPYESTLTAWRRQPDGSYDETVYRDGLVHPVALPGVTINLAELFAEE